MIDGSSVVEDRSPAQIPPETEWETDAFGVNRIHYLLGVWMERYPWRQPVSMGTLRLKGAMSGELTASILGDNLCPTTK